MGPGQTWTLTHPTVRPPSPQPAPTKGLQGTDEQQRTLLGTQGDICSL